MRLLGIVSLTVLQVLLGGSLARAKPVTTTITFTTRAYYRMDEAALLNMLKSPDAGDRRGAAYEIGSRGLTQHLGAIQSLFNDPDLWVRAKAAAAAFSLGDKGAGSLLRQMLEDADPWVVSTVAQPLVSDGDAKALEIARKLSKHTHVTVRRHAFAALWSSPDQEASYNALASALGDDSFAVRLDAVRALGKRHTKRALDILAARLPLAPSELLERWTVALAIKNNDTWASVPVLIELVADPDPMIGVQAFMKLRDVHRTDGPGYEAIKTPDGIREAADKWRRWWNQEGSIHPPDDRLPRPDSK